MSDQSKPFDQEDIDPDYTDAGPEPAPEPDEEPIHPEQTEDEQSNDSDPPTDSVA